MSLAAVLKITQKMAQPTPQEVEAQAYAFRQLVQHLQNTADDAQNIDVMSVAGMCRNCVAKWLHRGLAYAGDRNPSYDRALEVVYGEPYPDWKKKHQKKASPEQLSRFEASKHFHATHPPVESVKPRVCALPAVGAEPCCYDEHDDAKPPPPPSSFRLGVITVSDRASQGIYEDATGPAVEEVMRGHCATVKRLLVPDEQAQISLAITDLAASCSLVLTCGGTGFSQRDVTPEATRAVLEREAPGLIDVVHADALKTGEDLDSLLSRACAGVVGGCVVVNLPGRPAAAARNARVLLPTLARAVASVTN